MTDPFLKWVGGKRKLVPTIQARLPQDFDKRRYIEPFVGGGAVFFALQPKNALLADVNKDLIHCYAAVRDHVDGLVDYLMWMELLHRRFDAERYYYDMRDAFNAHSHVNFVERAAQFIYLNKTCFNGVYRVNSRGEFNVPTGRYKKPQILNEDGLRAASKALQGVDLLHSSFEFLLEEATADDFVYADPPYVPVSKSANFTAYTPGGFSPADQARLKDVLDVLNQRGCKWLHSNSATFSVEQLYGWDYAGTSERVMMARSINSDASKRGAVFEMLVRNYSNTPGIPAGPCNETWCICAGGPHVGCGVAKELDQSKRAFLLSLGK